MANNVLDFSAAARNVAAEQPDDTLNNDAFSAAAAEVAAQQKTALSAGVAKAATVAPSQFNEAFKLGKSLGMDSDMILRNPVEAKRIDYERRMESLQGKAPTLANAIGRNPELSPMLFQDQEAMSVIDPMLRDWKRAQTASENVAREQIRQGKGLGTASQTLMGLRAEGEREGQFNLEAMENAPRQEALSYGQAAQQVYGRPVAGLLRGLNDLSFGTGELATSVVNQFADSPWLEGLETFFRENRQYGYDVADNIGGADQPLSFVAEGLVSGLESFGMNIPTLAAGVAGAPLKAVMGMFGLMTTSASGTRGLEEGLSPVQALYYGATDGVIEVATEMAPFLRVMKDISMKSGFLKTFINYQLSEQPREQLATLAQDFNAFVAIEPDATLNDYLNARPEAAVQTVLAVLAAGGATAGAISIAQNAANSLQQQAEVKQADAEQLLNLFNAAASSSILETSPETFEQLLKEAIQEGGTAPEVLFIEAPRLRDIVGEEGLASLREASPLLAEQIDLALETSDLIELPTETVTRLFAGSGIEQALAESIRTDPDAPSAVEAREEAARAVEELQTRTNEVVGQQLDQEAWENSRQEVVDTVFAELGETRRFTADVNRVYADLVGNYYTTTAALIGVTPSELFTTNPLTISHSNAQTDTLKQREGLLPSPSTLTMPDVPSPEQMATYARTESVPLNSVVSFQAARLDAPRQEREEDLALVEGYSDKPVAVLLNTGEYVVYDGNHRTDAAVERGDEAIEMYVIDARDYDPQNAGRTPAANRVDDDALLAELFNQAQALPATLDINGVQRPTVNSNGQPLAQTEEGVRNFWQWFGDSKAVDAEGKPLVMYHGTNASFDVFDLNKIGANGRALGPGFYFTDARPVAEGYGENVLGVYLKSENPTISADKKTFKKSQVIKIIEDLEKQDEYFIYNYGDVATEGRTPVMNAVLEDVYASAETDADIIGAIINIGGVDRDTVMQAVMDRTNKDGLIARAELASYAAQEGERIFVVFGANQIKSATDNTGAFDPADASILNQEARGTFNPNTFDISLLEKANLSTFVHELGHFFFEMHATLAAQNASPEVVQDVTTLLAQVSFEGTISDWLQQPVDARRKAHETIAESFEQYLLEGKAPTSALQPLFRKLKNWMKSVYQSLQDFLNLNDNAQLTEEVRGVFDRMLAAQEEIDQTAQERGYMQLFSSAQQAGMTQEEWIDYQSLATEQMEVAMETHESRALRDMKWLDNAKSRMLKTLQAEARDRRKTVRADVTAEVRLQPVYRAMHYFKRGELLDAKGAAVTTENNSSKLSLDALREMYKDDSIVNVNALGFGKYGMVAKEGSHPDVLAPLFGFSSGDALVRAVSSAPNMNQLIEDVTDQRMLERYGDLATEQDVMDSVNEALSNEAHMKMVATELASGNKAVGRVSALRKAAKQLGREVLNRRKVRALRPDIARSSAAKERKAAERALAKGDKQAFATAKRNELLHLELEMQQRKLRASMEKDMRAFARMFKGKTDDIAKRRDMDLVNLARAVLANYGLSPEVGGQRAQSYQALVAQYDGPLAAQLQILAFGLPESMDYRELTVEEYTAVRDRVTGLWDLSRREKQVAIDGQMVEIDAFADGLVQEVLDVNAGELKPLPGYGTAQTKAEKTKGYLLGAAAHLVRVDSFARILGPNFRLMVAQVKEAATQYRKQKGDIMEIFANLVEGHRGNLTWDKIAAPELSANWAFNDKAQLLHAVLHTGNDSNMRKLLLGQGFSNPSEAWGSVREDGTLDTAKWDAFMSRMFNEGKITEADMNFVQAVWDMLDGIKEPAQRAHKDMFGYYFNEITARPVQTPFGEYRGGYVPAVTNDPGVQQKKAQEQMLQTQGAAMFPSTGSGFAEQRVEFNRALELDLTLLASHIDLVVKFTYLEPAVRDVGKLINNRRVARALNGAYPNAINGILMPWLRASASQSVSLPFDNPLLNKLMNGLRNRAGTTIMFMNFINTVEQLTGFSIAAYKLPKGAMVSSLARFVRQPAEMRQGIFELSPWMEDRLTTKSFMLQQQLEKVVLNPNALQKADQFFQRYGYITQQMMQNFMDVVVWDAAYNQAVKKNMSEKEAARYADEIIRTTQSSFAPEDVASVEVANPFTRLFLQFVGWFNMVGNFVGQEAVLAKRELGWSLKLGTQMSYLFLLAVSIPAMVSAALRGLPTEDDDEDMDGMLDEYLAWFFGTNFRMVTAMVPGVGQAATATLNAFNDLPYDDRISMSPGVGIAESALVGIPGAISKTIEGEEWGKKEIRALLTSFSLLTGIPTGFLARAIGFTLDVEEGRKEAEDGVDVAVGLLTGR